MVGRHDRRPLEMPATLYPRINIPGSDPRDGELRTPLQVPGQPGYTAATDITIASSDADAASDATVPSVGASAPAVPGGMFPFRLADATGPVHLRVAFVNDPASPSGAFVLPADLRIALVPAEQIPSGGSVVLNGTTVEPLHEMLPVSSPTLSKDTKGGYARIRRTRQADGVTPEPLAGVHGNILPLALTFIGPVPAAAVDATWYLVVRSASPVWVTFAVSEAAADPATVTELPWIHVLSSEASIDLGAGPFPPGVPTPAHTISGVRNFGTGNLVVSTSTTTDAEGDAVIVQPATIGAAADGTIELQYSAANGLASFDVDITSDDPLGLVGNFHNNRIEVSASIDAIGVADTVLVLDASGSMLLRPDGLGNGSAAASDPALRRRWDNLLTAVNHLTDGYIDFLKDPSGSPTSRLAIAVFPDVLNKTPGWESRAGQLVASATVTTLTPSAVTVALTSAGAAVEGAGLTPIGEGIGVAMGTTAASSGMFQPDVAGHRRWMVLMTDGAHNAGTIHPSQFYLPDAVPDFVEKSVRVYTIGYATTAVTLLQDLAENALNPVDGSGLEESQFAQAAITTGFEKDLTDTFLDALATSIGLTPTFDPPGVLTSSAPVAIHEFHVSPFDTGVGIFVDWRTRSPHRIEVALISPRCERFDREQLEKLAEFDFRALDAYAHAYISDKALRDDGNGRHRYGTWKLELRLAQVIEIARGGQDVEPYKFNVFNRSGLRMTLGASRSRWGTGETIDLIARLRANGAPVKGARVVATVDAPTGDYGTALANAIVDPKTLVELDSKLRASVPEAFGTWLAKAQAVGHSLAISRTARELVFHETAPGVYRASVQQTWFSGDYGVHLVATGDAGGVPYRRERALTVAVETRPDVDSTLVTFELGKDGTVTVVVQPRDAFGNVVIFDPHLTPRLGIEVQGGKPQGDVFNRFDGSYARSFGGFDKHGALVVVTWDGQRIAGPLPLPGGLHWMTRLLDDRCTTDPKEALGPVVGSDDPYAAIAAGGSIELGVDCPFDASHVAVFVHAESTQRYRVLVCPAREKRWRQIGVAETSQVFEVSRRFGALRAVKVVHGRKKHESSVLLQGVGYRPRRGKHP